MAKRGIRLTNLSAVLGNAASTTGWSLCVGAGTSKGTFPDWGALVRALVARDGSASKALADELLGTYSPDALIEAATRRLVVPDFGALLGELLYDELKRVAASDWPTIVKCLESEGIGSQSKDSWVRFLSFLESHPDFSKSSALQIADVLAETLGTKAAPTSVLSFNAEPLLFALVNAYVVRRSVWTTAAPAQPLDKITRATSNRVSSHIPYIFCHGLVRVPDGTSTHSDSAAVDKLVFSESQYLSLGNAVMSWQSAIFTETAITRPVVFVGVSLSDPNMRSWLSRIAENRRRELRENHGHDGDSTNHYWLNHWPNDDAKAAWIEEAVSHLGVRLIWLDDWSQVKDALRKAVGF